MRSMYVGLLSGALFLAAPQAANAVVTITSFDQIVPATSGPGEAATSSNGAYFPSVVGNNLPPDPCPCYRSPWEGTALFNTAYQSVSGGADATWSLASQANELRMTWGSPDDYNLIEFFLGGIGGTLVGSVAGDDTPPVPPGTLGLGFVNVVFSGMAFDTVRISSTVDAFEFANFDPVPIPAALPLFGGGLVLLGYLGRRRRKKAMEAAA